MKRSMVSIRRSTWISFKADPKMTGKQSRFLIRFDVTSGPISVPSR